MTGKGPNPTTTTSAKDTEANKHGAKDNGATKQDTTDDDEPDLAKGKAAKANPKEDLEKKRTRCRKHITTICKEIEAVIHRKGSRTSVAELLERAKKTLQTADTINQKLEDYLDDDEAQVQEERHLTYVTKIGDIQESVEAYLEERKDDAPSVIGSLRGANPQQAANNHELGGQSHHDTLSTLSSESAIDNSRRRLDNKSKGKQEAAPDEWIDEYRTNRFEAEPWYDGGGRSTIRTDLETYDGSPLAWFAWIDLFRALVHESNCSPGEKLAILKRNLKGDVQDIVYGLGGGESAYKEALRRLKDDCGSRDAMRAAHLQALEKLEIGKTLTKK